MFLRSLVFVFFTFCAFATTPFNLAPDPQANISLWCTGYVGENAVVYTHERGTLSIALTHHVEGDAKWYYKPLPIRGSKDYRFTEQFLATAPTRVVARISFADGSLVYREVCRYASTSGTWKYVSETFYIPKNAISLSVFHCITTEGILSVRAPSLTQPPSKKFAEGMVTLTFDDGFVSAYQTALPMCTAAGVVATHYVITDMVGQTRYLTWDDLTVMQHMHNELGIHTRTHRLLTTLSHEEVVREVAGSRADLSAMGHTVRTFAYPYGDYDDSIIAVLRAAGFRGARTCIPGMNTRSTDPFLLKCEVVKAETTTQEIVSWIDAARAEKAWLILLFHDIDHGGGHYTVRGEILAATLQHLATTHVKTVTVAEGLHFLR